MDTNMQAMVDVIIAREGGARVTNDPRDGGGRTQYGIAEKSNPEAWADGNVSLEEARDIYFKKYVVAPGFDAVKDSALQHQLVDFGVNSGPFVAIQRLQEALNVPVDGKLGPKTLGALAQADPKSIGNALVANRVKLLCKICVKNPSQLKFLSGWVNRALEFLV